MQFVRSAFMARGLGQLLLAACSELAPVRVLEDRTSADGCTVRFRALRALKKMSQTKA